MGAKSKPFEIEIIPGKENLEEVQKRILPGLVREFVAWAREGLESGLLTVDNGVVQWSDQPQEKQQ